MLTDPKKEALAQALARLLVADYLRRHDQEDVVNSDSLAGRVTGKDSGPATSAKKAA